MSSNRFLCLGLVFCIVALSVCLVPVGRGPFSAAYGPLTKFQAVQWLLLLLFLMAAAIGASAISAARWPTISSTALALIFCQAASRRSADSILRC